MAEREKRDTRILPIQGATFLDLQLAGNGKRSQVAIRVENARLVVVPLSGAAWRCDLAAPVVVEASAHDDASITIRIRPQPGRSIVLERAVVIYPGSDDEWREDMDRFRTETGRWECGWCVTELDLRLAEVGLRGLSTPAASSKHRDSQ